MTTLDTLTGGVFSAATSGERAARLREWLASDPPTEQMQEVFRELSPRDKGAARPLRERLDELKRMRDQEAMAADWAQRAQLLLDSARLNIADAIAWQRDAAKAGAPLSREPLSALKQRLADRVRAIEDLQHRVQVQREAAVLVAQRLEVLSTKPWREAQAAVAGLQGDIDHWQAQADSLVGDADWPSVDLRFPSQLDASRAQLAVVWDAFRAALALADAASTDAAAPLPPVAVWADELRVVRGDDASASIRMAKPKAAVDPAQREAAQAAIQAALTVLESEVAQGHGKASVGAANTLRQALKDHGKAADDALQAQAQAALAAAGELEAWQRWSADKVRRELLARAEALLERPARRKKPAAADVAPAPSDAVAPASSEAQSPAAADAVLQAMPAHEPVAETSATETSATEVPATEVPATEVPNRAQPPRPRLGGRKMQEALRELREKWKEVDRSAAPNNALWRRFDEACNEAYKVVQAWLDQIKAEAAQHRAQRLALIEEVKAWIHQQEQAHAGGAAPRAPSDWRAFSRAIHQFSERWRNAGHLGEKAFAELQPQWKAAISAAAAPLDAAQKDSIARRQALIDEARLVGAAQPLRLDAIKALQQRWQAEAQAVPLERKLEQKLWDAFRQPIDEAFQRKDRAREQAMASMSERDRAVLEASRALQAASASADAARIREAMTALDAAKHAQAQEAKKQEADARQSQSQSQRQREDAQADPTIEPASDAALSPPAQAAAEAVAPKPAAKRVVAMRGDDRPGMKRAEPAGRGERPGGRDGRDRQDRRDGRPPRRGFEPQEDRGPRLGDAAFRAQRDALDQAQLALRKLAAQAHGEALTHLLEAWQRRDVQQLPSLQELGRSLNASARNRWSQAIAQPASGDASTALLRLEMAAEVPTPAEHINARRALQLQLLTRRNDPSPAQTWVEDTAAVLSASHGPGEARRLQNALKVLMRRPT